MSLNLSTKSDFRILLINPPLTQLNTPYPGISFLAGYLRQAGYSCTLSDLGIHMVNNLFSRNGLEKAFHLVSEQTQVSTNLVSEQVRLKPDSLRVLEQQDSYLATIDAVMDFLRGNAPMHAWRICGRQWLPEGRRFDAIQGADAMFGDSGVDDKARYYASLYVEELGDFIADALDSNFGFSRYGSRLGDTILDFSRLLERLDAGTSFCDKLYLPDLEHTLHTCKPNLVCLSVAFPGMLHGALRIAQCIRQQSPATCLVLGGGYVSTELRSLEDPRIFDFFDYLCFDDGYIPLERIIELERGLGEKSNLLRTMSRDAGLIHCHDLESSLTPKHMDLPAPYLGELSKAPYLNLFDFANPFHRLWGSGRWNKLMLAHGCYWKRCTFCDTTLPYIACYDPAPAEKILEWMDSLYEQSGSSGFHFIDEAAPPALAKKLASLLIQKKRPYTWWTNIRFDRSFDEETALLMAKSGCIGVSGGIEVASERLLERIDKGVSLPVLARVCRNFAKAGIMTHAYLIYGFPTQTDQELLDSLEIVRQFFENGILQSAFWHRLTVTAHSRIGREPGAFGVVLKPQQAGASGRFAHNDLAWQALDGRNLDRYGPGLDKAIYNYMHGNGTDLPLSSWFDFRVPKTSHKPNCVMHWMESQEKPKNYYARVQTKQ